MGAVGDLADGAEPGGPLGDLLSLCGRACHRVTYLWSGGEGGRPTWGHLPGDCRVVATGRLPCNRAEGGLGGLNRWYPVGLGDACGLGAARGPGAIGPQ